MPAVTADTTWCTFTDYLELPDNKGGRFCMLCNTEPISECRVDESFWALIQPELDRIQKGLPVQVACIPDKLKQHKPNQWRLSLVYYRKREEEFKQQQQLIAQAEQQEYAPPYKVVVTNSRPRTKTVSFSIPIEDHALLHKLHEKAKKTYTNVHCFSEFLEHLLLSNLELVKLTQETDPSLPF